MKQAALFLLVMLCSVVISLQLSACTPDAPPSDAPSSQETDPPSTEAVYTPEQEELLLLGSVEEKAALLGIPPEQLARYQDCLLRLCADGSLRTSWQGTPTPSSLPVHGFAITKLRQEGQTTILYLTLYAPVYFDPATMEESWDSGTPILLPNGEEPPCGIPFGTSVVTLQDETPGCVLLSCAYTPISSPGITRLKHATDALSQELAASQPLEEAFPDIDPYLLQAIWAQTLQTRYVADPKELTLYDLEHLRELVLDYGTISRFDGSCDIPEHHLFDSQPIRSMKGLRSLSVSLPLTDYSVLEPLQLDSLFLSIPAEMDTPPSYSFDSLRIGRVDQLSIYFNRDFSLDLKGSPVSNLMLTSWSSKVLDFIGCEQVQMLCVESTTTDTTLIDQDHFPALKNLSLSFFSDTPRFRDLSRLASFGSETTLSLRLDYQAANNRTVESLSGVRLDSLILAPGNGPYPLPEPDPQLIEKIDIPADRVHWQE